MPARRRKRSHSSISHSESSVSSDQGSSKRTRTSYASPPTLDTRRNSIDLNPLRVHIISAKLSPSALENLANLVESSPARCQSNQGDVLGLELTPVPDRADVLITAVHTRPRLQRHVCWEVAKTKAIVTPDWLSESIHSGAVQPYGRYAALGDTTEGLCPTAEAGTSVSTVLSRDDHLGQSSVFLDPEASVREADLASLSHLSTFSCQRASPLTCPNQALVEQLDIIRRARFYEGEERSMLSYARAIASIKAYPHQFSDQTSQDEIAKLPYLGTKLTSMVEEFIKTGQVQEAQKLLSSPRFQSMSTFNSIHGIGPPTAKRLYSLGLQSIEDLEKYYEVTPTATHEDTPPQLETGTDKEISVDKSIKVSLALRHDFSHKIPRSEAEEIHQVIVQELEAIEAGCKSMIVGGYRRGKLESNDVDIVISHTDLDHSAEKVRGLRKKLVQRLHERGLVTHILNMSGYHPHNIFRTHHWDTLEKVLTVFVLPGGSARRRTLYRRVDLIFAPPAVFWTAVVGWTGSTTFERDLRLWAKQVKGLKFDSSGVTRRHDSKVFYPTSERAVFDLLGLPYVHPSLRNADA